MGARWARLRQAEAGARRLFVVVEVFVEADPLALGAASLDADVTITDEAGALPILHGVATAPIPIFVPAGLRRGVGHHAAAPSRAPRGAAITAAPGRATVRRARRARATIITARAAEAAGAARTAGTARGATITAAAAATVATAAAAFAAAITAAATAAVAAAVTAAATTTVAAATAAAFAAAVTAATTTTVAAATAAAFAAAVTAATTTIAATTAATVAAATLTRRATTIARGTARTARTARAPRRALFGGAHVHTTTAEARAVHRLHRRLRVLIVLKGHEPEATGLAGLPIDDDRRLSDGPKGLERFTQLTLACGPREPADEQPVSHLLALLFQGGPFRANLITQCKP